jgi:hypothetical protein
MNVKDELMIGSLVNIYGGGFAVVDDICAVTKKEIDFFTLGGLELKDKYFVVVNRELSGGCIVMESYVDEIFLREEYLKYLGFDEPVQITTDVKQYRKNSDQYSFRLLYNEKLGYCLDSPFFNNYFESVHKLQNLFYFVTGEKLCIDLRRLCELNYSILKK